MQKKMLLGVILVEACLVGWISNRGIGMAEAAGQQEVPAPQGGPRLAESGLPQQGDGKPLPTIPQEYFPPVTEPTNQNLGSQPKSMDLPTPSRIAQPPTFPPGRAVQPCTSASVEYQRGAGVAKARNSLAFRFARTKPGLHP